MNQQPQFNRLNGFSGGQVNGNGKVPKNNRHQVTRHTQPLTASQLHNIQQFQGQESGVNTFQIARAKGPAIPTEAQFARAKLSSKKAFDFEDDLEFYPNQLESPRTRSQQQQQLHQQSIMSSRMGMTSPYSTPTKAVQFNQQQQQQQVHRMAYNMSPAQIINSPQQQAQRVINHNQIFNSPQNMSNIRRLELSNVSPMYQQSPSRW